jgi:hypothetical protein
MSDTSNLAEEVAAAVVKAMNERDAEIALANFVCCKHRPDSVMWPGDYCFCCPFRPANYVERTAWQKFKGFWGFA